MKKQKEREGTWGIKTLRGMDMRVPLTSPQNRGKHMIPQAQDAHKGCQSRTDLNREEAAILPVSYRETPSDADGMLCPGCFIA